jgi:Uma2 family endonuclease
MTGPFAQVLDSPLLVEFRDQIVRKLEAERAARQRFRDQLDEDRREEFISGTVITDMAVSRKHLDVVGRFDALIGTWVKLRDLGTVAREQALTEFPRNDYCPDLCFWTRDRLPDDNGNRLIFPPPDFVIEVLSPSTERRDRGVKFEDYAAHDVREYWIVDAERKTIEQYVEQGATYRATVAVSAGTIRSEVLSGFEMPVEAAFDDAAQIDTLRALLQG